MGTPCGSTWLSAKVAEATTLDMSSLDLPMKTDENGELCHFDIDGLKKDQQMVMAHILNAVEEWEQHDS